MRMEITANAKGLTVHNPTPYYITLAWLSKNAKTMLPGFDSLMIAPLRHGNRLYRRLPR